MGVVLRPLRPRPPIGASSGGSGLQDAQHLRGRRGHAAAREGRALPDCSRTAHAPSRTRMDALPTSTPTPTAHGGSAFSINDVLNLPAHIDLLDDVDLESAMMMLEAPSSPSMMSPAAINAYRRESNDNLELSVGSIAETFSVEDTESPHPTTGPLMGAGNGAHARPSFSPGLKIRVNGRHSLTNALALTPVVNEYVHIKQEVAESSTTNQAVVKQETANTPSAPDLSPVMDSFLRESWEDIVDSGSRSARSSLKSLPSVLTPTMLSPTLGRVNPLPLSFFLPGPSNFLPTPSFSKNGQVLAASIPGPPSALRTISAASTASSASTVSSMSSNSSGTRKAPRRAKQCVMEGCTRRAQSNNRCKTHGGGARCQMPGCDKSSQGGGLCRAHGGGKKCRVPGCTKGTQRLGLCYLHGGIRRCIMEGCKKKDRGNGYCISHGGGRRCEIEGCTRSVRKGNHCQMHQNSAEPDAFMVSRG